MKLISIIVLLTLLIIPLLLQTFLILYALATKGSEGIDSPLNRIADPQKLKSRHKQLYSLLIIYGLLFLAALFWVTIEFTNGLGQISPIMIIISVEVLILFSFIGVWTTRRVQKTLAKIPPLPPGASDKAVSDWLEERQNLNFEENMKLTPRRIRGLLIMVGVSSFVLTGTIVIAAFLFK